MTMMMTMIIIIVIIMVQRRRPAGRAEASYGQLERQRVNELRKISWNHLFGYIRVAGCSGCGGGDIHTDIYIYKFRMYLREGVRPRVVVVKRGLGEGAGRRAAVRCRGTLPRTRVERGIGDRTGRRGERGGRGRGGRRKLTGRQESAMSRRRDATRSHHLFTFVLSAVLTLNR